MNQETLFVVSNIFKEVSNHKNIITYDEVIEKIKNNDIHNINISIEQGISELQVEYLRKIFYEKFDKNHVSLISYFDTESRCLDKLTHKVKSYNTLISDPKQIEYGNYKSLLMIDERCAELSDHVTGKHIQFMVLVESARQMVNAVTEKFYSDANKIYLANDIKTLFKNFVYPFRTELVYRVIENKIKIGGNGKMFIQIDFDQNNQTVCSLEMNFTILDRKFVTSIEDSALKVG